MKKYCIDKTERWVGITLVWVCFFYSHIGYSEESNTTHQSPFANTTMSTIDSETQARVESKLTEFRFDTLSFSKQGITKEGLSQWYLNMLNLNRIAFEEFSRKPFFNDEDANRITLSLVNTIVTGWISRSVATVLHEQGHAEAAMHIGADAVWHQTKRTGISHLTLGELFLQVISGGGRASTISFFIDEITSKEDTIISAAGVNQNTYFSEMIAHESIRMGKFHYTEMVTYLYNKGYLSYYALANPKLNFSDLRDYTEALEAQGIIPSGAAKKTVTKIAGYSLLTALLSGMTWNALRSQVELLQSGNSTVDLLSFDTPIGKITWPEFNTYLNSDNVSLKGDVSLMRSNQDIYTIGVESSIIGKERIELLCGTNFICRPFDQTMDVTIGGRINLDGAFGVGTEVGYRILDSRWKIYGGVDYDTGTLQGARRTYDDSRKDSVQTYGGLGIKF